MLRTDGGTDAHTDGRTDNVKTVYPLQTKFAGGIKIEKEGKMSFSIFSFIYTIHLAYLKVYTLFENTDSNRSREICDRNFHWRERNMNK